jgi:hypothetical protein
MTQMRSMRFAGRVVQNAHQVCDGQLHFISHSISASCQSDSIRAVALCIRVALQSQASFRTRTDPVFLIALIRIRSVSLAPARYHAGVIMVVRERKPRRQLGRSRCNLAGCVHRELCAIDVDC